MIRFVQNTCTSNTRISIGFRTVREHRHVTVSNGWKTASIHYQGGAMFGERNFDKAIVVIIGHVNVQSYLLIIIRCHPISLQYS